jgi:hypothetical protein
MAIVHDNGNQGLASKLALCFAKNSLIIMKNSKFFLSKLLSDKIY